MSTAARAPRRGPLLTRVVPALVVIGVVVAVLWDRGPRLRVDATRHMVFDAQRIELVAGFDDRSELEVWNDVLGANPDRDEVAIALPREGVLRWHALARPGRFVTQVARRQVGPDEDRTQVYVTVRALGQPGTSVRTPVPPIAANPSVGPGSLRQGPTQPVELELPRGARSLEIVIESPDETPDGAVVLMLSPVIEQTPAELAVDDHPLRAEQVTQWLLPLVTADERQFVYAQRQRLMADPSAQSEQPWENVRLPMVEAVGSFSGPRHDGRPSLALLGRPVATSRMRVTLLPDSVLRASVALDDVMPAGTTADLQVLVDGELVTSVTVDERTWRDIAIPLGTWANDEFARVLELRVDADTAHLEPGTVERQDVDFVVGDYVWNVYRPKTVRVGVANPRLVRPIEVPRRLSAEHRLSVVFIQVETLRADLLGAYGGSIAGLTPNLDRLASRSVVWDLAFTPSPWTIPSTVSHMTGLLPAAHGATDHDRNVVPGDVPTLAELARDEGIATGAIVTNDLLKAQAGYARGFSNFALLPYANARQVTALAESWLADHVGQQFFLFLHYFDPHHPFNAPGEYKTRYVEDELADRDIGGAPGRLNRRIAAGERVPTDDPDVRLLRERYLGEVAWLDAQIGRLLDTIDELGLADTTAVVFTADHGEEFLEHGLHGHGSNLYDESLHVPLMIMAPEQALGEPRRISQVTATLGLFETLLDVMDVEGHWVAYPDLLDRHDFAVSETHKGVLLDGRDDPLRRYLYSVRTPSNLLIWREPANPGGKPQWDFYDLRNDPGATQRKQPEGKVFMEMVEAMNKMRAWSEKHRTSRPRPGGDAALAEALRGLGYVGGGDEQEAEVEPKTQDSDGESEGR